MNYKLSMTDKEEINMKPIESPKKTFTLNGKKYSYYDIEALHVYRTNCKSCPFIIRILFESFLRKREQGLVSDSQLEHLARWSTTNDKEEIPFFPERIILQDFTGVPAILDLAALREETKKFGQRNHYNKEKQEEFTKSMNPQIPVDLVIDHSVQIDFYGRKGVLKDNHALEMERNKERYEFLNWAKDSFSNFSVIPPATGIVHQVNMEYLAKIIQQKPLLEDQKKKENVEIETDPKLKLNLKTDIQDDSSEETLLFPDVLVGTDSHTTMINGLGVLGWGVGGIEAEAGMLGMPSYIPFPKVVGVELVGKKNLGVTATDLALYITKTLRDYGVVDTFIEYFGEGVESLSVADRTTIANMAPEYGATSGYFPVDDKTIEYLRMTGRKEEDIQVVETYLKKNHMYQTYQEKIHYSDQVTIHLGDITPALAGPKRPQDFIKLEEVKVDFKTCVLSPAGNHGYGLDKSEFLKSVSVQIKDTKDYEKEVDFDLKTGDVLIAAITSCTNTSNPSVMMMAGLLAKNAVQRGLTVPPYVKTSLAPGSKVVTAYLHNSGLLPYLEELGFYVAGYGCTTCIGNSGPLLPEIEQAIEKENLLCASVLSGNRNFEGRINPYVKANYLASPPLVVAYALAGTMLCDLTKEPIGYDKEQMPVFLKEIWPSDDEIQSLIQTYVTPQLYLDEYENIYQKNTLWNQISRQQSGYQIPKNSTYIKIPPFVEDFMGIAKTKESLLSEFQNMAVLAKFGNSVTTDHISPAGSIAYDSPAGIYLRGQNVEKKDFNTYGSRRGNDQIMVRGTFANIRIRNELVEGIEGGYTRFWPTNEVLSIYEASERYIERKTPLLILAGKDYGMGSSRDWAAKGTNLLGVKVVLAESYERIHRSNLIMMGVLPLQFLAQESAKTHDLNGSESYSFSWKDNENKMSVTARREDGTKEVFEVQIRIDSEIEFEYLKYGGILNYVLKQKADELEII